jgi:hypothetical protein
MEIGKPKRTYTVEPIEDPVPKTAPAPEPTKEDRPLEPAKPRRD